eukprot:353923-Chlamydomonas_euryale.AAC.1
MQLLNALRLRRLSHKSTMPVASYNGASYNGASYNSTQHHALGWAWVQNAGWVCVEAVAVCGAAGLAQRGSKTGAHL